MRFGRQSSRQCYHSKILVWAHTFRQSFVVDCLADPANPPKTTTLLHALAAPPNTSSSLDPADVTSTHIAAIMFSHLLRSSPRAKAAACQIIPGPLHPQPGQDTSFFVPADGGPPPAATPEKDDDDDETQTFLQVLTENLSLSLLSRSRADTSDREAREWDRYVVGYLCLLSQWLWEDPKSVRGFLDAGGLNVVCDIYFIQDEVLKSSSWWNRSIRHPKWTQSFQDFAHSSWASATSLTVNLVRSQGHLALPVCTTPQLIHIKSSDKPSTQSSID